MTSDVFRFTPRAFQQAVDAGVFGERKVELLRGVPHVRAMHPAHQYVIRRGCAILGALFSVDRWTIYQEFAVRLGRSLPMPDLAVVHHPHDHYLERLAGPSDIRLIVEVADTTWAKDRGKKYRLYAQQGIPEYWIIRLDRREAHVFTEPVGAHYRHAILYGEDDLIPLEGANLALTDWLPPS
jgi:Uma2 family endonuclease